MSQSDLDWVLVAINHDQEKENTMELLEFIALSEKLELLIDAERFSNFAYTHESSHFDFVWSAGEVQIKTEWGEYSSQVLVTLTSKESFVRAVELIRELESLS